MNITKEDWRKACYYAVREQFNNTTALARKNKQAFIDKKMDVVIRTGIDIFLKNDNIPFPASFIEMDAIYHCMRRRGIVDPRDPSNQLKLQFGRRRKAA